MSEPAPPPHPDRRPATPAARGPARAAPPGASGSRGPAARGPVVQAPARRTGLGFLAALGITVTALGMLVVITIVGFGIGVVATVASFGGGGGPVVPYPERPGNPGRAVAILPIEGTIDAERAWFARAAVDHVLDQGRFAAVVVRVDSGGGGVSAADQIWHEVDRLRQANIPVVASFGGMATSGGYYVASHADEIVAEPTCITGSIGVIAQVLTFGALFEKVGVEPVTLVASGSPQKDVANDTYRPWTEEDRTKVTKMLDAAYDTFRQRVQTGRTGALAAAGATLDEVANGDVFAADAALANGLVDGIGYLDDAVVAAERRAGVPVGMAEVVRLGVEVSPMALLPLLLEERAVDRAAAAAGHGTLPADVGVTRVREALDELGEVRLMYRGF